MMTTRTKRLATLALRGRHIARNRQFSTTPNHAVNPLANLSAFAFAKEAQYLSKAKNVPREEFYSTLHLIRSSEVDPFAPAPGASPVVVAALRRAQQGELNVRTAYEYVVANMAAQLESSKADLKASNTALLTLQDKHRKLERHAFALMLAAVTSLAIYFFRPDALEIIKRDIEQFRKDLGRFDWQWLGNPPSYKSIASAPPLPVTGAAPAPSLEIRQPCETPLEPQLTTQSQSSPPKLLISQAAESSHNGWTRLFWA